MLERKLTVIVNPTTAAVAGSDPDRSSVQQGGIDLVSGFMVDKI